MTDVTPTGSLYGTAGSVAPAVDAFVIESFDRAAPKGVGNAKLAGEPSCSSAGDLHVLISSTEQETTVRLACPQNSQRRS